MYSWNHSFNLKHFSIQHKIKNFMEKITETFQQYKQFLIFNLKLHLVTDKE